MHKGEETMPEEDMELVFKAPLWIPPRSRPEPEKSVPVRGKHEHPEEFEARLSKWKMEQEATI